jgi:aldehyde dehydrogenase (NAD+)
MAPTPYPAHSMSETVTQDILRDRYRPLVGGEPVAGHGEPYTNTNPATADPLTAIEMGDESDIDRAVAGAAAAFEDWWRQEPQHRGRVLAALADLVREHSDRLARLETLENGKPLSQAASEVDGCARYFEYYAGLADKVQGESIPLGPDHVDFTVREPLGVTAHIVPWNYPLDLFARSVAPALATGNTAVVKPAEYTSVTALEVGELALEAGVPPDVLNIVPGYGSGAGAALAGHPDVDGVSFTGSVGTGREVAKRAVDNINPVHLELGGKSPSVVFPDADLENAIKDTVAGIFVATTGQICLASSRLLVHEDIYEDALDHLVAATEALSVGPGMDDPDVGPLVSEAQFEKVKRYLEAGKAAAGAPLVGGDVLDRPGYFIEPTVFEVDDRDAKVAQEEIFGPVLSVLSFADEEEAIELANGVDYGLVAGVFTSDIGRAHRFARDVKAGQIYINEWAAGGKGSPFGGYKQSGFGRDKGTQAVDNYTQVKTISANITV